MKIERKDVAWNLAGTFMRVASGVIILPLVLRKLPTEEYALWSIFLTINSITALLDFGFSNSFSRNVAYVFSGAQELKTTGFTPIDKSNAKINYSLLKSLIQSMKRYYGIMSLGFLILFFLGSPFYLSSILEKQHFAGNHTEVWISWFVYGSLVAYEFYTYYYNSLMTGRGYIKRNMQIIIFSQSLRIAVTFICLMFGLKLISLVIGIFVSDILNRTLSYLAFYDKEIVKNMKNEIITPVSEVIKVMASNAAKIGLTTLGFFAITQVTMLISPFFIPLAEVAKYGISKMLVGLIVSIGGTWFGTFYPKLTQYRIQNDYEDIKRLYIKGILILTVVFVVCGSGLLIIGNPILKLIHSKTFLLDTTYLFLLILFSFFEASQSISTSTLLTKNEVPFFKSVLISGGISLLLLIVFFKYLHLGVLSMILAPGIALSIYNNWKWPMMVIRELKIRFFDFYLVLVDIVKSELIKLKKQ